jgi:hypothetical protein
MKKRWIDGGEGGEGRLYRQCRTVIVNIKMGGEVVGNGIFRLQLLKSE